MQLCRTMRGSGSPRAERGRARTHFFLSMFGISLFNAFSQITGIRSGYFFLIRSASARRFSNECSSCS